MKIITQNYNLYRNNPNFGTTSRFYKTYNGDEIGNFSWMFREDINWKSLVAYELENFKNKNKVNIIQFASSDGSEAYTKLIAMQENGSKEFEKFYPIVAYDIDEEIVNSAKSGLINFIENDFKRLANAGIDYKKYFYETGAPLNIKNDRMYHLYGIPVNTLEVSSNLQNKVKFHNADMFDIVKRIEDDSNTVLLCRNVMLYLQEAEIKSLINTIGEKLKEGSLFVLGKQDFNNSFIKDYIEKNDFEPVMKYVYRKIK